MINIEQLQRDLDELPEEAQELLIDFVELLKKDILHLINKKHHKISP